MAVRRMFAKEVLMSDGFFFLPAEAKNYYVMLGMNADDDGFVGNPGMLMLISGAKREDLDLLEQKGFVITFDSGAVLISHWLINNRIRKDRYCETSFIREKSMIETDENGVYVLKKEIVKEPVSTCATPDTAGFGADGASAEEIPSRSEKQAAPLMTETAGRAGNVSAGQPAKTPPPAVNRNPQTVTHGSADGGFCAPTREEADAYAKEIGLPKEAEGFYDYYSAKGWVIGTSPVRDWRAAMRAWKSNAAARAKPSSQFSEKLKNGYVPSCDTALAQHRMMTCTPTLKKRNG